MATMPATVTAIRRLLKDEPAKLQLNGAIASTTSETVTVNSGETAKISAGVRLEHDDGSATGAEQRRVLSVTSTTVFEAERGYLGSTAVTHSDDTYLLIAPRFPYDEVVQAVNVTLDSTLYAKGVYDIIERTITSSATTDVYNAPNAATEELLGVYQFPASSDEPIWLKNFDRYPRNVATAHFATGKAFAIRENYGTPGTEIYYCNCKEKLTISTLTTAQERIVHFLAAAYLLDWETPKRLAGPTNQGDRSTRTGDYLQTANWFRQQAEELIMVERSNLRSVNPPKRVWIG